MDSSPGDRDSVPESLRYAARRLSGFRREWRKVYPENSRTGNPNEWSEFVLPKDCFCDLSSFTIMGDLMGIKSDPSATVSLPRHSESYIGRTEVAINSVPVDTVENANHLFHMQRPFAPANGSSNRGVLKLDMKYTGQEALDNTALACVDVPATELLAVTSVPVSTPGAYYPLTANCMAWYDFSDPSDLGRDVSGYGRHGTPLDGPTWSSSRGNSLSFQGNTASWAGSAGARVRRVDLSAHAALYRGLTAFTVSGWVRTLAQNTMTGGIFNITDRTQTMSDWFIGGGGTSTLAVSCRPNNANAYVVNSSVTVNDGRWHHWAASAGPAGNYLIVDGVLATNYTAGNAADTRGPWSTNANYVALGANVRSASAFIERAMDVELADITVWNYQLSTAEVEHLFRDRYGSDVVTIMGDDNAVGQVAARAGIDDDLTPLGGRVLQFGADTNRSRTMMPMGPNVRAYYDFPDAPNITRDVSGNSRTAVNSGCTASTERGGSITLNGTSNSMELWNAEYANLNDVTVSCWARYSDGVSARVAFSFCRNQTGVSDWLIYAINGVLAAGVRVNGVFQLHLQTTQLFNDNNWHHCVFTTGRRGNTFWVDGVAVTNYLAGSSATIATVRDIAPTHATIGANRFNTAVTSWFSGGISDVLICNQQLTHADVQRLYMDDYGYDVYPFIGQNNAVGWTTQQTGVDDVYTGVSRVDQYMMDSNVTPATGAIIGAGYTVAPATNPINFSTTLNSGRPANSTGMWRTCFEALQPSLLPRRRRILMLPLAAVATGFRSRNWNRGDVLYTTAVNVINHVMSRHSFNTLRGIIQSLGERDADDQNAVFGNAMLAMYQGFLNDIPAMDNSVPFVATGIRGSLAGATWITNLNTYLSGFTTGALNYAFVDVSDLTIRDSYNFDLASYRTLGTRVATALTGRGTAISANVTANPNSIVGAAVKPVATSQLDHVRGDTPVETGFWRRYAIETLPLIRPPRRTLMFVPAARVLPSGETPLSQIDVAGLGYTLARDLTTAAMATNPWNQFRSLLFFNGDADGLTADAYRAALSGLFNRLKVDWTFWTASVPLVIGLRRSDFETIALAVGFDIGRTGSVDSVASTDLPAFPAALSRNYLNADGLDALGSRFAVKSSAAYDRLNVATVTRLRFLGQNGVTSPLPVAVPGVNAHRVAFSDFPGLMASKKIVDVQQFGDVRFKVRWADSAIMSGTGRPSYQVQNMYALVSCAYIGDPVFLTLMREVIQRGGYKIPFKRWICFDEPPVFAGRYEFALKTRSLDALHCAIRTGPNFFDRSSAGISSVRWRLENQFYPNDFGVSVADAFVIGTHSADDKAEDSAVTSFGDWQNKQVTFTHRWSHDGTLERMSGFSKDNNEPITGSWDMDGLDATALRSVRPIMFAECSSVLNLYANRRVTVTY